MKPSETTLKGRREIQEYTGRGWSVILRWIDDQGFPAIQIGDVWQSDKILITEWFRARIQGAKRAV